MDIKGNKKNCSYHTDSKKVNKENVGLLLNSAGFLLTTATSKAEVLIAFFAQFFINKGLQASGKRDSVHSGKQQPALKEDWVKDMCHDKNNSVPLTPKRW